MTVANGKLITERLTYPTGTPLKYLYKTPILLYRMGLGPVIGRLFMIITTTGRKSGLPRRTAIEFHQYGGMRCFINATYPMRVHNGLAIYRFGEGEPVLLMPGPHRSRFLAIARLSR